MSNTEVVILMTRCGCSREVIVYRGASEFFIPLKPPLGLSLIMDNPLPTDVPEHKRRFVYNGQTMPLEIDDKEVYCRVFVSTKGS